MFTNIEPDALDFICSPIHHTLADWQFCMSVSQGSFLLHSSASAANGKRVKEREYRVHGRLSV